MTLTKKVLIVDDEDDIREVAQLALEELAGWRTIAASSGTEGIVCARDEHPDAILLDVMMPDMDGVQVLGILQADASTAAIPVILLTAKVQAARKPPAGAAGVIVKPFDPLRLGADVAAMLNWPAPQSGS